MHCKDVLSQRPPLIFSLVDQEVLSPLESAAPLLASLYELHQQSGHTGIVFDSEVGSQSLVHFEKLIDGVDAG
jgi:hypothetical protein